MRVKLIIISILILFDTLACEVFRLVVYKQTSKTRLLKRGSVTWLEKKYGLNKVIPEPLINAANSYYYGAVSVGTPPQLFTVDFDTGSSDFWLVSNECTTPSCNKHLKYSHEKSSTYIRENKVFGIVYGDGSLVRGYTSYDSLAIGGMQIKMQGFAEITKEFGFDSDREDGLLGLGYASLANTGFPTPIDNAFNQKLIEKKIFAFYLNRDTESKSGGELIIGDVDLNHYIRMFRIIQRNSSNNNIMKFI